MEEPTELVKAEFGSDDGLDNKIHVVLRGYRKSWA